MKDPKQFTEAEFARIQQALTEKAPQFKACPLCGTDNWTVVPGLVTLTIQPERTSGSIVLAGGPMLPNIAFLCIRCGNTILLNTNLLGIADLFRPAPKSEGSDNTPSESEKAQKAT